MRELQIWYLYSIFSFQKNLIHRLSAFLLIFGKVVRISLFSFFLYFLFQGTSQLVGYSKEQVIFFYLTFTLIDTVTQLIFREVYRFRDLVKSGNFDFVLLKPINPLIRVLLGGTDPLDFITLALIIGVTFWYGVNFLEINPFNWVIYIVLILNAIIISAAFHIFVLALGIITIEINQFIGFYRDFTAMLRLPIDIFIAPVRFILTFLLPLAVMLSFPPKALFGKLSLENLIFAFLISLIMIFLSNLFWNYSLKRYQSASS